VVVEMANDPKPATEVEPTERRPAMPSDGFVTIEQLMEEQGITEPQGLDSFHGIPWFPEVDD
jgi:hypothetical protein